MAIATQACGSSLSAGIEVAMDMQVEATEDLATWIESAARYFIARQLCGWNPPPGIAPRI